MHSMHCLPHPGQVCVIMTLRVQLVWGQPHAIQARSRQDALGLRAAGLCRELVHYEGDLAVSV